MYTNDRNAYRHAFFTAWQKYEKGLFLEPVETQLVAVILQHPEYLSFLTQTNLQEFPIEENPFLHMSLHMAIREQIYLNNPSGIKTIYQQLCDKHQDAHQAEHVMMQSLYQMINTAQQTGEMPGDEVYLALLREAQSSFSL